MKNLLLLLLLVLQYPVNAQHGGVMNNWHFGWFASIEFTTGTPIATSGSNLISVEGCISYSDDQGNLLFYSNGGSNNGDMLPWPGGVWNRNHQMMPNGSFSNNMGSMSAAQSALVIPKSGTEYYLFTMGAQNGTNLRYCIVDMSLDGGLGDVTNLGTILLDDPGTNFSEGLIATRHANEVDYWLTVRDGNEFYTYLVNSSGITGPTVQAIGLSGGSFLKFSVQGDKMMTSQEVFDFDNATGVFSNPFSFQSTSWGHAFSPSGQYVYRRITGESTIYQYDLNTVDILASEMAIGTGNSWFGGSMQLGPDLKLYIANKDESKLAVINDPDVGGTACDFVIDQVDLGGMNSQLGLPNFIDSELLRTLAIEELETITVKVFPNPSTGEITINSPNDVRIERVDVVSLSGQTVASYAYAEKLTLDVAPGAYVLVFKSDEVPLSRTRIVVK